MEKVSNILDLKKMKIISHLGSLLSLALDPELCPWQFSAALVIFSSAWGLAGAVKISNLYLQASTLGIYVGIGYPVSPV